MEEYSETLGMEFADVWQDLPYDEADMEANDYEYDDCQTQLRPVPGSHPDEYMPGHPSGEAGTPMRDAADRTWAKLGCGT